MAEMLKVTARWDGFVGAPGYSNFFFVDSNPEASWDQGANASAAAVEAFFGAVKHLIPNHATITVQSDTPIVDSASGEIVGFTSSGTHTAIAGTAAAAAYSAASGGVVTWRTVGVRNGRRVRGRTFVVPLANVAYENNGSLVAGAITSFGNATGAILNMTGTAQFGIWSRPSAPGATDGQWFDVMNATVPDKVAILRSRRD